MFLALLISGMIVDLNTPVQNRGCIIGFINPMRCGVKNESGNDHPNFVY